MASVKASPLPAHALLSRYRDSPRPELAGAYTDCYTLTVPGTVTLAEFVTAFYTTWVFKLERVILARLFNRPSTDAQARQLADGARDAFAAWDVEDRTADQLLMCDVRERTRSWFMVEACEGITTLFFGSAVTPVKNLRTGRFELGPGFAAVLVLGFHKLYSRVLLHAAKSRLVG